MKGGDVLRAPEILPTGRNLHGFDPFRLPASFAHSEGCRQAEQLLARHQSESGALPESVALVLWGTDNLKTEGVSIAQALALLGAEPRQDSYGRVVGARLLPLEQLGRPRIDVLVTLSGIFRDLLPMQTQLLAEASWLAATADEDIEQPRAGLEGHLLIKRAHTAGAAGRMVCDINRHPLSPGALHCAADAAQRAEVVVDGGHAKLNRVEVLICEIDILKDTGQQI